MRENWRTKMGAHSMVHGMMAYSMDFVSSFILKVTGGKESDISANLIGNRHFIRK